VVVSPDIASYIACCGFPTVSKCLIIFFPSCNLCFCIIEFLMIS